jgi:C-terminal processing protease CtpA/Prc
MDEAVDFMNNPKNQDIKIAILRQIEAKKSITITPDYAPIEDDLPTNNDYIEEPEKVTKVQSPEFVDEEELAFVNERKNKRNKSNNTI